MSNIVTVNLRQPESYREFIAYAAFDTNPETNKRAVAINLEVTRQELDSLFSTKMYERPYQPEYYNPLEEIIGELWTDESETEAMHMITDKVNQFIPRIQIDNQTSFTLNSEEGQKQNHALLLSLVFYYKNDFNKTLYNYKRLFDVIT
jgi:phage baseplate assembly protein W